MRVRRSRLSSEQTRRLLEHFVAGTPARVAAELVRVNRNTATLFYHRMRELIAQRLSSESPPPEALVPPADETVSSGTEERPAKVAVFALVRRGDKVLTVMMPGPGERTARRDRPRLAPDSIVYAEAPGEALDVSTLTHERVPRRARLAHGRSNISSTENFWSQAKRQLRRYNGVPRQHLHLFLKECEWRYNYGPPKELLRLLKSWLRPQVSRRRSMPGKG